MTTPDDIRKVALALPGVTEGLHFRLPTFKVAGRGFITVQKDAAILAVPQHISEALSESEPEKYETVWRNGRFFVGLKVNLHQATILEIEPLIKEAFENRQ